jgi:hypothetical protein
MRRGLTARSGVALVGALLAVAALGVTSAFGASTRNIPASGITSITGGVFGSDGIAFPEFNAPDGDAGAEPYSGTIVDRSDSHRGGHQGDSERDHGRAKSNPELTLSFDGLNFRQQRLANGGNQFSVEPPDQGMCAGNGYVLESINDVLRVFNQSDGSPATGVTDLNTFYGYPAAIDRAHGNLRGPFVTDPSCLFDAQTQRWFNVVLTLEQKPGGGFTGPNHLDVAVSQTANPTGAWTVYRIPVQDDGTQGTPDHGCSGTTAGTGHGACIGDYPHIGADDNGFYVTTNEYSLVGPEFHGAQIYAFSKAALAAGSATVAVTQLDTNNSVDTGSQIQPGFTVWPAQGSGSNGGGNRDARRDEGNGGGKEYFLSSNAGDEATSPGGKTPGPGTSNQLILWTLSGTKSLASASPSLTLGNKVLRVPRYAVPPKSEQKAGDFPLGQCLNTPSCATSFILGIPDPFTEVISHLDSNDTRMQQVTYSNGKVWGALDTALTINGVNKAGIEYFAVSPEDDGGRVSVAGYLGLANNNLTYPAIGMLPNGRGAIAFTVVGQDYYPSAGYAALDQGGAGAVHIAAPGLGPSDGFTSYKAEVGDPPRTRWGDYGAAAVDGGTIWIASEYIGQTCALAQYTTAPFGSCGGTRATLGNWATRISALRP